MFVLGFFVRRGAAMKNPYQRNASKSKQKFEVLGAKQLAV